MVFARITWWKIKPGMRNEAVNRMNQLKSELQSTGGYRGVISLLSMDNPDRITNVVFFESEADLRASEGTILKKAADVLSDVSDGSPRFASQEVGIFDMAKIVTRA